METGSRLDEFFIDRISTDFSELELFISTKTKNGVIKINEPRAFRVFAESDGYMYLSSYKSERIIYDGRCSKILTSKTSKYIEDYLKETPISRLDEINYSCLVATDQYCVEAIVFEDPKIEWHCGDKAL